jgi:4-aminobutyrate aminotransferase-like enzyme
MSRIAVGLVFSTLLMIGCSSEPRALVLCDGSGHATEVQARVKAFTESSHREVRVLPAGADAVKLASRGECEVALVTPNADVIEFEKSHGSTAGTATLEGTTTRVLLVNVAAHPKIDGPGAAALATFFASK